MQNALLAKFISKHSRQTATRSFGPGDTIRVHVRIQRRRKGTAAGF